MNMLTLTLFCAFSLQTQASPSSAAPRQTGRAVGVVIAIDSTSRDITIKTDAGRGALTVLAERQNEFPGVVQQPVSIRAYPYGGMAAQALGYVGQVSEPELKLHPFRGVKQGTVVGQEGVEYYYDRYLRGRPGTQRVEVNASGYPVPSSLAPTAPQALASSSSDRGRCPKCQHVHYTDAQGFSSVKFCEQCGTALARACSAMSVPDWSATIAGGVAGGGCSCA